MLQETNSHAVAQAAKAEKRSEHRRRVLKSGVMLFNKGYASYGCRVRNLTEKGAMVEMGETAGVPSEFEFRMDGNQGVPANVIWRTGNRMGIQFAS